MIDAGRVLQPLDAAAAAIERLDEYRVPAELADAIEETQRAVDRALRLLLRADARAPDDLRLTALSPDTPLDRVVAGLRQRGLITMELAGRVHELGQATERARSGAVRASDADVARETVRLLRYEVGAASEPVAAVAHESVIGSPSPWRPTTFRRRIRRIGPARLAGWSFSAVSCWRASQSQRHCC